MAIVVRLEISTLAQLREIAGITIKRIAELTDYNPRVVGRKFLGQLPVHLYQVDQFWNAFKCGGDRLIEIDRDDFVGLLPYVRPDRRVKGSKPGYVALTPRQQRARRRKREREARLRLKKAKKEAGFEDRGE